MCKICILLLILILFTISKICKTIWISTCWNLWKCLFLRFLIISSAWVYILVAFGERRFSSLLDMHPGPRGNFMIRLQHSELFLIFCDSQGCFCNQSSYLRMSVKTMHAKRWDTSFWSKCYLETSLNKLFHAVVCL